MTTQLEAPIGRALARWVGFCGRRAAPVVALLLLGACAAAYYAASHLGIEGATEQLFAQELPFKQNERDYLEAFPTQYENIFVVIDAVTPERAGAAATAMLAGLQAEPRYFQSVYLPGGGDFFETHAFLYLKTAELEDLADRLAANQPYLAELSRDGTLYGLTSMMDRGVRAVREGDVDGDRLRPMIDRYARALDANLAGEPYHVSWAEVLAGDQVHGDARRRFLLVQPVLDFNDLQPAKRAILAVRRIAEELDLTPETGVQVRLTGDVALSYEEMETVKVQASTAGLASFLLVGAILWLALRSLRMVLATLFTLLVGLVYTAGFTAVAVGHFNLISVSFAVLFIGLGVDFGIHLCLRYREILGRGRDHADALVETARDVGSSLVLCALTTSIGFFAFVPTDFVGVAELGLISGAGMFISLFLTMTLLPALLSLPPVPTRSNVRVAVWSTKGVAALPLRYPRAVRATAIALGLGAILLIPEARFDNNPLHVRDPASESVRTFNDLLAKGGASPWSLNAIAPNLPAAEAIAAKLRALPEVGRVVTVSDYVPADQDAKLDIIEDVAMFLAPTDTGTEGTREKAVDHDLASLVSLADQIRRLLSERPGGAFASSARELQSSIYAYLSHLATLEDPSESVARLEESLMGSLPEQLRTLNAALGAGHVTLENLPDALVTRMVTGDGRVRIQIFPSDDMHDHATMAAFVDSVKTITPNAAGSAAEVVESGRAVVHALRQALLAAFLVISVVLLALWRQVNDTALVLVPLSLAALFTVAAGVVFDIPFNFADVIVLPLLLGIGVDSGIHLVHRARVSGASGPGLLGTSTARAVGFSALTTIASFGTMGLATHLGLATLGRLLALGVAFTVVCNLVLLPSLIVLHPPRRLGAKRSQRAA